jgi:hypothetical protein
MTVSINGTSGLIFNDASSQNTSAFTGGFAFRNRLINSDMRIDQRNAGASVTITNPAAITYTLDRWFADITQASKFSVEQTITGVSAPVGFTDYLGATSLSAYSVLSGDYFFLGQKIEGYNVADLAWGTASAATVTLSFWVRSSLTGTFGGAVRNGAGNRSYPFTYTISAANTWEQKSITIAGDTSGTWLTTNGAGLQLVFGIGVGTTYSGTAGAWAAGNFVSATGATSVVGTNTATFYITGVQLEKGSTATSFDYRPYGTELALCQRYYNKSYSIDVTAGTNTGAGAWRSVSAGGAGWVNFDFPVEMRAVPTITPYSIAGTSGVYGSDVGNWTPTATYISTRRHSASGNVTSGNFVFGHYVASIEL